MSPLLVSALRRLALLLVVLATGLVLIFRVLPALGVLGPDPEELIQSAAAALETARDYGAAPEQPQQAAAAARLEEARHLEKAGDLWKARRVALHARDLAVGSQRAALVQREGDRRQARKAVDAIDELLNRLEDLHATASRGADRDQLKSLMSIMKRARATGAALLLAFEQGNYRRVRAEEPAVKTALEAARKELEDAAGRR